MTSAGHSDKAAEARLRAYLTFLSSPQPAAALPIDWFASPLQAMWDRVVLRTNSLKRELVDAEIVEMSSGGRRVDVTLTSKNGPWRASCVVEASPEARIEAMQVERQVGDERPIIDGGVIVLNGTSSSGKSSLAAALQERLEGSWLHAEMDLFARMLPRRYQITPARWGSLREGSFAAVAALARARNNVIFDIVLPPSARSELAAALDDVPTVFIGVTCQQDVAEEREAIRADRAVGLVAKQIDVVHRGCDYDFTVDTVGSSPVEAADQIADWLNAEAFRRSHGLTI